MAFETFTFFLNFTFMLNYSRFSQTTRDKSAESFRTLNTVQPFLFPSTFYTFQVASFLMKYPFFTSLYTFPTCSIKKGVGVTTITVGTIEKLKLLKSLSKCKSISLVLQGKTLVIFGPSVSN